MSLYSICGNSLLVVQNSSILQSYLVVWGPVEHVPGQGPKALWWEGLWTAVAFEPAG